MRDQTCLVVDLFGGVMNVLSEQDMAISALPEVEMAVGTLGRPPSR